jgi:hypothetical protein
MIYIENSRSNTKITEAPRLAHSSISNPILPEEWFPIKRTGSIASYVGPAVIKFSFLLGVIYSLVSFQEETIFSGSAIPPGKTTC